MQLKKKKKKKCQCFEKRPLLPAPESVGRSPNFQRGPSNQKLPPRDACFRLKSENPCGYGGRKKTSRTRSNTKLFCPDAEQIIQKRKSSHHVSFGNKKRKKCPINFQGPVPFFQPKSNKKKNYRSAPRLQLLGRLSVELHQMLTQQLLQVGNTLLHHFLTWRR